MSEMIIADELGAQLEQATGPVDLRTESGRKLGNFVPEPLVPWDPSITREELDRRMKEPGRSWTEIRKRFEAS